MNTFLPSPGSGCRLGLIRGIPRQATLLPRGTSFESHSMYETTARSLELSGGSAFPFMLRSKHSLIRSANVMVRSARARYSGYTAASPTNDAAFGFRPASRWQLVQLSLLPTYRFAYCCVCTTISYPNRICSPARPAGIVSGDGGVNTA